MSVRLREFIVEAQLAESRIEGDALFRLLEIGLFLEIEFERGATLYVDGVAYQIEDYLKLRGTVSSLGDVDEEEVSPERMEVGFQEFETYPELESLDEDFGSPKELKVFVGDRGLAKVVDFHAVAPETFKKEIQ